METRNAKLIINKSGGTASEKSKTYRVTIPNSWIEQLGLNENYRDVELAFDGDKIIINKALDINRFIESRRPHKLLRLDYYNFNNPCSTIIADYTDKNIKVKNHTDDIVLTAFGVKANPDWQDYSEFLEDRCIPRTRAGLQNYLDALKIDEYNPLDIIKKTEGRMAEDYQWIKVTEL